MHQRRVIGVGRRRFFQLFQGIHLGFSLETLGFCLRFGFNSNGSRTRFRGLLFNLRGRFRLNPIGFGIRASVNQTRLAVAFCCQVNP